MYEPSLEFPCAINPHLVKQSHEHASQHTQSQSPIGDPLARQLLGSSLNEREEISFQLTGTDLGTRDEAQTTAGSSLSSQLSMAVLENQPSISPSNRPGMESNCCPGIEDSNIPLRGNIRKSTLPSVAQEYGLTARNLTIGALNGRPDHRSMGLSENVSQESEKEEFQNVFSEITTSNEHEIAFLTRHYVQTIGPW